jgi:hypothetical protein
MKALARRIGLGSLLADVLLVAAIVVGAPTFGGALTVSPAVAATTYANPVSGGLGVNPSILKVGSTYYAYLSGFDFFLPFPVMALQSTDLASWTQVGNVLANAGAWANASSGRNFSSPSVRHIASNPASSRYVMYFTGKQAGTGKKCIGVATSSSPTGPFSGAAQPLICPSGGAQDPSGVVLPDGNPYQEVVYKKNGANPGIYNQVLTANGLSTHPSLSMPYFLFAAHPTWWHNGTVERPTITIDASNNVYLLFSGAAPNTDKRAIGWTPCSQIFGIVTGCSRQTHLGTFISGSASVSSPSGPQVFYDGAQQWLVYDGLPGGACGPTTCTGTRSMRVDKLCFAHGQPRTNAPSSGAQTLARNTNCSADIPGAPVVVQSVTDNLVLSQPAKISFRDGGATTALNGRVLWMFSDGFGRAPCQSLLTNSAALGVPAPGATSPHWSTAPLDAKGCASQFIPFTTAEVTFNQAHQTTDGKRVALWEQAGIPLPNGDALAFFLKLIHDPDIDGTGPDTGCNICYEFIGNGAVHVPAGSTVANRSPSLSPAACNPTCLFSSSDGAFGRPFVNDGFVYAYDGDRLARAPLGSIETRSAWRFWTDAPSWSPLVTDADPVPGLHEQPDPWNVDGLASQVTYNPYLDRYVNIVGDNFFDANRIMLQTAPAPEGPWTPEVLVHDAATHACAPNLKPYGALQSLELTSDGGRTIPFTYARPGPMFGMDAACPGQVRMAMLRFR